MAHIHTRALEPQLSPSIPPHTHTQGVLSDGCKIVVFSATLEMVSQGSDSHTCCLKLSVNSLRRALAHAPLGFVHPPALTRGLSVKAVALGETGWDGMGWDAGDSVCALYRTGYVEYNDIT
jgi:hypothetical protein